MPQIVPNVRFYGRMQFIRTTVAGYYGLGNAAESSTPWEGIDPEVDPEGYRRARRFQEYDRAYPIVSLAARVTLWRKENRRVEWFIRSRFEYNFIQIYEGSKLEADLAETSTTSPKGIAMRDLLKGTRSHAMWLITTGVMWDTRNNEFTPYKGFFHEISLRASPGVDQYLAFFGATINLRVYQSIYKEYLVFAARVIGDIMVGRIPFYLLAEHGGYQPDATLGGEHGVRGVPLGRFHGKIKLLGNVELRSKFLSIGPFFKLGALVFADIGRAWLDTSEKSGLFDGQDTIENWFGWKASIGGGLRLHWGSFVGRFDIAYSNINELGIYLNVGHVF